MTLLPHQSRPNWPQENHAPPTCDAKAFEEHQTGHHELHSNRATWHHCQMYTLKPGGSPLTLTYLKDFEGNYP